MKPAPFEYVRAASLGEAAELLRRGDLDARLLAGGQSLGPMLNLRLAQPGLLVDITGVPELLAAERTADGVYLGACVTHANVEDGRVPDATGGILARIAGGIAYRAVRNRGTLGGSLAHGDPAGDWPCVLPTLGAVLQIDDGRSTRELPAGALLRAAFEPALAPGELIAGMRLPTLSPAARWGYYKHCRKPGELAEAMAAVLWDPERDILRVTLGALDDAPCALDDASTLFGRSGSRLSERFDPDAVDALLQSRGIDDPIARQMHRVVLRRAVERACA
ncbi:carbon monoxide dehydrogenase [Acidihalobacter aeolianus]|uniref:Carbon monoxide dehydrogenase n=1 Tax=Acidihalobacter aeolianus TaxID=2792603 RepID=A0A1D8K5U7_9GAMM|nr:FAD binding domain-containing protein [Acidihalobacter aeolianus]AOV16325.1 carbon monoxide dehydrogenase [Acidihalobacter aeolianus]